MRALVLIATLTLAACSTPPPAMVGGNSQQIKVEGDVFYITPGPGNILVRNFDTGLRNQDRLFRNAQAAVAQMTLCKVASFTQRVGVNTYDAVLDCTATS